MPNAGSTRQRRANRNNARKSTGPRTPEGKARIAANNLKHGLLARTPVAAKALGESPEEFDAFVADLREEFQPRSLIETSLLERFAACYWRLHRAHRFEAEALVAARADDDPIERALEDAAHRLTEAERDLAQEHRLCDLLEIPPNQLTEPQLRELEVSLKDFARAYGLLIAHPGLAARMNTNATARETHFPPRHSDDPPPNVQATSGSPSRDASSAKRADESGTTNRDEHDHPPHERTAGVPPLSAASRAKRPGESTTTDHANDDELRAAVRERLPNVIDRLARRCDNLRREVRSLQKQLEASRHRRQHTMALPDEDNLRKFLRYETMLDRQFHRTLAELRRIRAARTTE